MVATSRASCTVRSGPIRRPERTGMSYSTTGRSARPGHGPEVGRQAGRRRAVVVRGDDQDAGGAGGLGLLGHQDRVGGVVGPRRGDHRDGDGLDDRPEQRDPLGIGEHRALAGGAGHHQPVAAVVGQVAGQ